MDNPFASIVIPTCDRPDALAACLRALEPQVRSRPVEVLVCDDGNSVVSKELVKREFRWARWCEGPRKGPAANRNRGAFIAQGIWLIFLDDDCVPRKDFLTAYWSTMDSVGCTEIALEGATFSPAARPSLLWEAPYNPCGGALISCNFAIARPPFLKLGGFDERFPMAAFEDTDFEARLRANGMRTQFIQEAAVDHPLRKIPNAARLAKRWEARVISTLDLGARPSDVLFRLLEHVAKVIVSRFRGQKWSLQNLRAAGVFAVEFFLVLWVLPSWIRKHASGPRSTFWAQQVAAGHAPTRFGL